MRISPYQENSFTRHLPPILETSPGTHAQTVAMCEGNGRVPCIINIHFIVGPEAELCYPFSLKFDQTGISKQAAEVLYE